jgi:hypothetical protein
LGVWHPDYLLAGLTSRQLKEWEMYYSVEPFGEIQQYYQTAQICCILANVNRDSKKQPQPFKVEDFMPKFEKETKKDKVAYMKKQMSAMATKFVKKEDNQSG